MQISENCAIIEKNNKISTQILYFTFLFMNTKGISAILSNFSWYFL